MKYSCNYCPDQSGPCIVDVTCVDQEPPYSCIYANGESDMEAEWKPVEEKDNEARQQHDAPLMSDNLRSEIDAANKNAAIKNGSTKDPKSRYYGVGGLETLDIIKAKLTPEQYRGFLLGNIIKYSCRANHKGSFDRDMEKVRFYGAAIFGTLTGWNKYGGTCK